MRLPRLLDIVKLKLSSLVSRPQVRAVVGCIYRMCRNGTVEDMSDVVQDFYENMNHRFNEHHLYKGNSELKITF